MEVLGRAGGRRPFRDREDHVDDEVDGDDVERAVGQPEELGQLAATVGEDERVGDLEAVDPAGVGVPQRALDDRGAHDRQPVSVARPELLCGALGERLGERVDVGQPRLSARVLP